MTCLGDDFFDHRRNFCLPGNVLLKVQTPLDSIHKSTIIHCAAHFMLTAET